MLLNAVRFGAKRTAFWCKTQGKKVQNARRNGAKRSVKCCKTQDEKHKYSRQWYKQNILSPPKSWLKGVK